MLDHGVVQKYIYPLSMTPTTHTHLSTLIRSRAFIEHTSLWNMFSVGGRDLSRRVSRGLYAHISSSASLISPSASRAVCPLVVGISHEVGRFRGVQHEAYGKCCCQTTVRTYLLGQSSDNVKTLMDSRTPRCVYRAGEHHSSPLVCVAYDRGCVAQ